MKKIAILGSTGSIGTQTLEVVRENRDIEVTALAAGSNIGLLEAQIRKFHPVLAAVWDEAKAKELRENVKDLDVKVVSGMDGLIEVAVQQDTTFTSRSLTFSLSSLAFASSHTAASTG